MINPQLEKLFARYESAFQSFDFKKMADLFSDTFQSVGPHGIIANGKNDFLKQAEKASEFYKSIGQTSVKIMHEKETLISENYSMVTVHWGATFKKTGDKLVEFDVSYIIHLCGNSPQIILFISHLDEQETMKRLGVIESEDKTVKL